MTKPSSAFKKSRRTLLKGATGAAIAFTSPFAFSKTPDPKKSEMGDLGDIKVLAFDFQGSVVDAFHPINEMGMELNARKGLSIDWAVVTKVWTDNFIKGIASHKDHYVPVAHLYREALDLSLDQIKLGDHFSDRERDEMNNVWNRMIPWPDSVEGLTRLKRRYTLTTLSNASMASVFQTIHQHGLPFDQVLTGELVHAYKPDPQVYDLVTSLLGYRPDEVLYCATHFADLSGAKKQGFKTAWWPRPFENGPGHKIDTEAKPFVDMYVADIVDLAEKLAS